MPTDVSVIFRNAAHFGVSFCSLAPFLYSCHPEALCARDLTTAGQTR